jgi:hypothetical protein
LEEEWTRKLDLNREEIATESIQMVDKMVAEVVPMAAEVEAPPVLLPPIDLDCKSNIKQLLSGMIAPKALERNDLFIGEAPVEELQDRI